MNKLAVSGDDMIRPLKGNYLVGPCTFIERQCRVERLEVEEVYWVFEPPQRLGKSGVQVKTIIYHTVADPLLIIVQAGESLRNIPSVLDSCILQCQQQLLAGMWKLEHTMQLNGVTDDVQINNWEFPAMGILTVINGATAGAI